MWSFVPWDVVSVDSSCFSIAATCCVFDFVQCIIGSNMALYINDNHNLFYQLDTHR